MEPKDLQGNAVAQEYGNDRRMPEAGNGRATVRKVRPIAVSRPGNDASRAFRKHGGPQKKSKKRNGEAAWPRLCSFSQRRHRGGQQAREKRILGLPPAASTATEVGAQGASTRRSQTERPQRGPGDRNDGEKGRESRGGGRANSQAPKMRMAIPGSPVIQRSFRTMGSQPRRNPIVRLGHRAGDWRNAVHPVPRGQAHQSTRTDARGGLGQ